MIVVVNDNKRRLETWSRVLSPNKVKIYSHPNYLLSEMYEDLSSFDEVKTYIFDRIFYGEDFLATPQLQEIKMACPKNDALFLLSSAHHQPGDKVKGFDFVISSSPSSFEEIERCLVL